VRGPDRAAARMAIIHSTTMSPGKLELLAA
jgi:hypothetical protein